MRGRLARGRLVVGTAALAAALLVSAVGVAPAGAEEAAAADEVTPWSVPGMAVSLAQAGELRLWGDNTYGQSTVPASLTGVAISQVVLPRGGRLALTADGRVVGWGANPDRLHVVPSEVAAVKVAQIATQGGYAGAVTRDGRVLMWGKKRNFATPLDVPAGLTGVKQLAITDYAAAALKTDGSVVAWGQTDFGQTTVPVGLKATAIGGMASTFVALTDQGTVAAWGNLNPLRASLLQPGNVKAIATGFSDGIVMLADNSLELMWEGWYPVPAEVAAVDAVLLANGSSGNKEYAVVDRDGVMHYWTEGVAPTSEQILGEPAQLVLGDVYESDARLPTGGVLLTKMLRAELPRVAGAAKVGSVLTGVPGTFSAEPESVTSQWLVNGAPVSGGAQLVVTAGMVGKTIGYRSTATKPGEAPVTSTSTVVTVSNPVPPVSPSRTKVVKIKVAKKAASVTVTGKITASTSPAGTARVTIKKGKKVIVAKSVRVSAAGAVNLTVKKFNKLVAKKTKAKGKKAKSAYRGKYTVTIAYGGAKQVKPSSASKAFKVK